MRIREISLMNKKTVMKKPAQVVMLSTNEKAASSIMLGVMPNVAALTKDVLDDIHDWMKFGEPRHL